MKKLTLVLLAGSMLIGAQAFAADGDLMVNGKVGIGPSPTSPSAVLEVNSQSAGFAPPRMTSTQRNAIVSPVAGLLIFNTTENTYSYFNGTSWVNLSSGGGYALMAGYTAGLNPADSTAYYLGVNGAMSTVPIGYAYGAYAPKAGVVKAAILKWFAHGTAGSNQPISVYLRQNDYSDTLIATVGTATNAKVFMNTNMNINFGVGDNLQFRIVCPAWTTNPTSVTFSWTIYIE